MSLGLSGKHSKLETLKQQGLLHKESICVSVVIQADKQTAPPHIQSKHYSLGSKRIPISHIILRHTIEDGRNIVDLSQVISGAPKKVIIPEPLSIPFNCLESVLNEYVDSSQQRLMLLTQN
eukprot:Protomagalhaensia_wolfi_Nauph_80__2082@NODE_2333_length_1124_cov_6_333641_g1827_i0_p1_GENE_NODE_2333_length_1124_cov_6_333641_g1827_i0NODE_2333_length_1124_cov_6_333641_g1827_i0_p1_ORF_typecomplete_len121_score20_71_NODE_2333_length_1124_cov_6_333641_g1827_i0202564